MIRVRVFKYLRWAEFEFEDFVKHNESEIMGINRRNRMCILRNGDEIHFVPKVSYPRWEVGRKDFVIEQWEG